MKIRRRLGVSPDPAALNGPEIETAVMIGVGGMFSHTPGAHTSPSGAIGGFRIDTPIALGPALIGIPPRPAEASSPFTVISIWESRAPPPPRLLPARSPIAMLYSP